VHYSAIHGARKVPELGDSNLPERYPSGGLALSAAAMARALTLGKNGAITFKMILASKESNKPVTLTKVPNQATGKESFMKTAFSFANWGGKTHEYVQMIKYDLKETSRQTIVADAHQFYKRKQPHYRDEVSMDVDDPDGPRRKIRDLSDDEN
jgi:hypothetical protein